MKTSTMLLLAGAAGVGYYLYKRQQATVTVPVPIAAPGAIAVPTTVPVSGYFGDDGTELSTDDDGNVVVENYVDDSYGSAVPYGWGPSWGSAWRGGRGHGGHGGHSHGGHGGRH